MGSFPVRGGEMPDPALAPAGTGHLRENREMDLQEPLELPLCPEPLWKVFGASATARDLTGTRKKPWEAATGASVWSMLKTRRGEEEGRKKDEVRGDEKRGEKGGRKGRRKGGRRGGEWEESGRGMGGGREGEKEKKERGGKR